MIALNKELEVGYLIRMISGKGETNSAYSNAEGFVKKITTSSKVTSIELKLTKESNNFSPGSILFFNIYDNGWDFEVLNSMDWDR